MMLGLRRFPQIRSSFYTAGNCKIDIRFRHTRLRKPLNGNLHDSLCVKEITSIHKGLHTCTTQLNRLWRDDVRLKERTYGNFGSLVSVPTCHQNNYNLYFSSKFHCIASLGLVYQKQSTFTKPLYSQSKRNIVSFQNKDDDVYRGKTQRSKHVYRGDSRKFKHKLQNDKQTLQLESVQYSDRELQQTNGGDSSVTPDESDVFGTLTTEFRDRQHLEDELSYVEEEDEGLILPRGRRNTPIWYGNQMKKLVKNGQLKEALEMFEVRMLKEDKVHPDEFNYNVLIGACGRAGYTKKAFKLYNDMKRRGLKPSDVTYTALINACAESPWPTTDGLTRLNNLKDLIQAKTIRLNAISYRALIKAYTKCGDILLAFATFDEMISAGYSPSVDSFNVLLMACVGEKDAGFRMAIQVWRQMLTNNIQPTTITYNLLLRAARDCGIGDVKLANQLLLQSSPVQGKKRLKSKVKGVSSGKSKDTKVLLGDQDNTEIDNVAMDTNTMVIPEGIDDENVSKADDVMKQWWQRRNVAMVTSDAALQEHSRGFLTGIAVPPGLPNLLDRTPNLDNVATLSECISPDARLGLIGGVRGVLNKMKEHGTKPNIKTYALFLESVPMNSKAESELMVAMDTEGAKGDVSFYNAIIRRRTKRNDLKAAKSVVSIMNSKGLYPDLRTYVNLACACYKQEEGLQLLTEVKAAGFVPNLHMYGALVSAARKHKDYQYLIEIMKQMKSDNMKPNDVIIQQLERAAAFATNIGKGYKRKMDPQFAKIQGFRGYYSQWLEEMEIEMEEHPWEKFKVGKSMERGEDP